MNIKAKFLACLLFYVTAALGQVTWDSRNYYRMGAVVNFNGVIYVATKTNQNKEPANFPEYWSSRSNFVQNRAQGSMSQITVLVPLAAVNQPMIAANPIVESVVHDGNSASGVVFNSPPVENAAVQTVTVEWDAKKIYTTGKIVTYNGNSWRANYWTQGNQPGLTEAWSPTDGNWQPNVPYMKGQTAIYGGIKYIAQWWTKGDVPQADKTGAWLPFGGMAQPPKTTSSIDTQLTVPQSTEGLNSVVFSNSLNPKSYPLWSANVNYQYNSIVSYKNAVWRKTGASDTRKNPAEDGQWIPLTLTNWSSEVTYVKGMQALVGNDRWYSQWNNKGIFPTSDSTGVWIRVDSEGNRIFSSRNELWNSKRVYVKGDACTYDGVEWVAENWSQGDTPGEAQVWHPISQAKWYSGVAYKTDERVTYKNIVWSALNWTKGDEPSVTSVWKPLGTATWYPKVIYLTGDKVIYEDITWTAQSWTQGDVPSTSKSWKTDTTLNWIATRVYVAGDKVKYDGTVWTAQWWTQGNKPTESAAWKSDSVASWYAARAYSAGDKVKYSGETWTAQWWTQGDEPGSTSAWIK